MAEPAGTTHECDRVEALARLDACASRGARRLALIALLSERLSFDAYDALAKRARREGETPYAAQCWLRALADPRHAPSAAHLKAIERLLDTLKALRYDRAAADQWLEDAMRALAPEERAHLERVLSEAPAAAPTPDSPTEAASRDEQIARLSGVVRRCGDPRRKPRQSRIGALAFAACVAAFAGYAFGAFGVDPPLPPQGLGSNFFWRLVGWVWVPGLIASWMLALVNAHRTRTFSHLSMLDVSGRARAIAGRHEHFASDLFYHLFQFVWVPLVLYLVMIELSLPSLLDLTQSARVDHVMRAVHAPLLGAQEGPPAPHDLVWLLVNEPLAWIVAGGFGAASMLQQVRIQHDRSKTNIDIYWWDLRYGWPTWTVRLIMVGVDMALCYLLLQKSLIFVAIVLVTVFDGGITVTPEHVDGFAGLSAARDAILINAGGAFILGTFVFASWFLHRGLPQYRASDASLGVFYLATVSLVVIAPTWRVEHVLNQQLLAQKSRIAAQVLAGAPEGPGAIDILALDVIQGWEPSLLELNILNSPLFLLLLQAGLLGVKAVRDQQARFDPDSAQRRYDVMRFD